MPAAVNATAASAETAERAALHAAARWYARLASGTASEADHSAWQQWHDRHPQHAQAWARMQRVRECLDAVPPRLASPTLKRRALASRRDALRTLLALVTVGGAGWTGYAHTPWRVWTADRRTTIGERLETALPDGSLLILNTATAVDVAFDPQQRRLRLYSGEILVRTAPGTHPTPFVVETPHGRVRALGTRFIVRLHDDATRVVVLEHAVETTPVHGERAQRIDAGRAARFDTRQTQTPTAARRDEDAWTRGSLIVSDQTLAEVAAELSRYRRGGVGVDAAVAMLRVSGAFPIDDTDRALAVLARSLPVRMEATERGERVRLVPR
jgi:transmembrane sensor